MSPLLTEILLYDYFFSAQSLNKHQSLTGDLHPSLEEVTPQFY